MAAITICSDFGAPKNKVWHCFHCFPNLFPMKWWDKMPWSSFSECWAPLPKIFIKVLCIKAKTRNRLLLLLSHSAMSNTCELMDCSPPGFSVHGVFQAKILEWVAIPFSRISSQPRDRTQVSRIAGRLFTGWVFTHTSSASASVLPVNIQGWFPLGWTGWISLHSKGLSRVFSNTTV